MIDPQWLVLIRASRAGVRIRYVRSGYRDGETRVENRVSGKLPANDRPIDEAVYIGAELAAMAKRMS